MAQSCSTTLESATVSNGWTLPKHSSIANNVKLRSMVFTGVSPFSRQPLAWYYQFEKQTVNDNYGGLCFTIEVFTDSTYIPRSRVHVEILLDGTKHYNTTDFKLSTCGAFEATNAKIGEIIIPKSSNSLVRLCMSNNDYLTLRFTCTLHEEILIGNSERQELVQQIPDSLLVNHLGELLTKSKFSDVTIIIGQRQFPVHKAILAARSSVFAAMFEHEMQESKENVAKITDINPEVFQEVLRFIYTGTVQKMEQLASALLVAADKYALGNLKTKCGEHLGSKLSVQTATTTLALADRHNAHALKQQAIQFISKHVKQLNPSDWKQVLANNFDVAAEIIAQMVKEK